MPRYPGALWMPLPETNTQPRIVVDGIVLHTHVGNPSHAGTYAYMGENNGQECHFSVLVGADAMGQKGVAQFIDSSVRADNQGPGGNSWTEWVGSDGKLHGHISIETGDLHYDGDPNLIKSWSQLAAYQSVLRLVVWLCQEHGIPPRWMPDPRGEGIGFHSMWGYNTPQNMGQNPWTSSAGKTCPGPLGPQPTLPNGRVDLTRLKPEGKIGEMPRLIADAARLLEGDDMLDDADKKWLVDTIGPRPTWTYATKSAPGGPALGTPVEDMLRAIATEVQGLKAELAAIRAGTAATVPAVNGHTTREADRIIATEHDVVVPPLTVKLAGTAEVTA